MKKRKKGESKFKPRSYRFSLTTQRLISKLTKRTESEQNDVVRKALEMYQAALSLNTAGEPVNVPKWIEQRNEQAAVKDPGLNHTLDSLVDSEGNYAGN